MNRLSASVATSSLLVADAECGQIQALIGGSKAPVLALDAQAQGCVLGQISEGLRQQREAAQPIRTLHLIAHGRPGAFRIGNVWIDAEALKAHANELAHWGVETIALWSCHVGADAGFVALLAELSGAQVLASADWLGRDAITTSGLIYSNDGEAIFLNNNEGEQQWTAMQNRLNATLDAIAAQQPDPSNRLQVSVLGMGDGSDANFPAIYSDLFGLRTFNNSKGGWSYDYFTSYALPDFVG